MMDVGGHSIPVMLQREMETHMQALHTQGAPQCYKMDGSLLSFCCKRSQDVGDGPQNRHKAE